MPVWLKGAVLAFMAMIKTPFTVYMAWKLGQKRGRLQLERDQLAKDNEAIRAVIRASDNAALDDDSLRNSPSNRDK